MTHPRVEAVTREARTAIEAARSAAELEQLRVGILGRQGTLTQLLRSLGSLSAEERPLVGAAANEAKRDLEALLEARLVEARERRAAPAARAARVPISPCPVAGPRGVCATP